MKADNKQFAHISLNAGSERSFITDRLAALLCFQSLTKEELTL